MILNKLELRGRHLQAFEDLREVPRELEQRIVQSLQTGSFQARWDAIVAKAEGQGLDGKAALLIAAKELTIDFVEVTRDVLFEREKATFAALRK